MTARRMLMSAIAAVLVYGNLAVALQPPAIANARFHLPCPDFVLDAFLMTGMFSTYSTQNTDPVITGFRDQSGFVPDRGIWIELHTDDFLAGRRGVRFTELFSAHEWDMHGSAAQRRSFAFLARRIRERHNRLHSEHAVVKVAFGVASWPQSPRGYDAGKRNAHVIDELWFSE